MAFTPLSLENRSWLAVLGKPAAAICTDLALKTGLAATRRNSFPLMGAASDAGWYLILAEGRDHRLIQAPVLATLSAGCEVLTCTVQESFLSSAATGWRDGHKRWSVTYEGEDAPGDVVAEGDLPVTFALIRQNLTAKSQAEDAGDLLLDPLFEIPIDPTLMQRLFGG